MSTLRGVNQCSTKKPAENMHLYYAEGSEVSLDTESENRYSLKGEACSIPLRIYHCCPAVLFLPHLNSASTL